MWIFYLFISVTLLCGGSGKYAPAGSSDRQNRMEPDHLTNLLNSLSSSEVDQLKKLLQQEPVPMSQRSYSAKPQSTTRTYVNRPQTRPPIASQSQKFRSAQFSSGHDARQDSSKATVSRNFNGLSESPSWHRTSQRPNDKFFLKDDLNQLKAVLSSLVEDVDSHATNTRYRYSPSKSLFNSQQQLGSAQTVFKTSQSQSVHDSIRPTPLQSTSFQSSNNQQWSSNPTYIIRPQKASATTFDAPRHYPNLAGLKQTISKPKLEEELSFQNDFGSRSYQGFLLAQLEQLKLLQQLQALEKLNSQTVVNDDVAQLLARQQAVGHIDGDVLLDNSLQEQLLLDAALNEVESARGLLSSSDLSEEPNFPSILNTVQKGDSELSEEQLLKAVISEPVEIDLPEPQTQHEIQQEELLNEQLFQALSEQKMDADKLSDEEKSLMEELGVSIEEVEEIVKMVNKTSDSDDEILSLVNKLDGEEIDALTELSDDELKKFAEEYDLKAKSPINDLKVVEQKRSRRQTSPKHGKVVEKRSIKKSVSDKLKELYSMIDRLEETKQSLLKEVENVKRRAKEQAEIEKKKLGTQTKREAPATREDESKSSQPNAEPKNIVKTMMRRQAITEKVDKIDENLNSMSTSEIKELAGAMKNMLTKIETLVKNETANRKRRKRSLPDEPEKEIIYGPGSPDFSFLEFGKDDMGSYTEFDTKKSKRDLKSVLQSQRNKRAYHGDEIDKSIPTYKASPDTVSPTYHAPHFKPDPQFLSGRFVSRELPPPVSPEVIGGFTDDILARRRRHTEASGSKENDGDEKSRTKRHLDFLFPRPSPKEELLYFSVSKPKTVYREKVPHSHVVKSSVDTPTFKDYPGGTPTHTSHSGTPYPPTPVHTYVKKREAAREEETESGGKGA